MPMVLVGIRVAGIGWELNRRSHTLFDNRFSFTFHIFNILLLFVIYIFWQDITCFDSVCFIAVAISYIGDRSRP